MKFVDILESAAKASINNERPIPKTDVLAIPIAKRPPPLKVGDRVYMDGHKQLRGTVTWTDGSYAWADLRHGSVRLPVSRFTRRSTKP